MIHRSTLYLLCCLCTVLILSSCAEHKPARDENVTEVLKIIPLFDGRKNRIVRFQNGTLQEEESVWENPATSPKCEHQALARCVYRRKFILLEIPQVTRAGASITTMGALDDSGVIEVRFNRNIDIGDFTSSLCMRGFMQVTGKNGILADSTDVQEAKEDFNADHRIQIALSFSEKVSERIAKALKEEGALSVYMDGSLSGQVVLPGKETEGKKIYSFQKNMLVIEPLKGDRETLVTAALLYSGPLARPLLLEGPFTSSP